MIALEITLAAVAIACGIFGLVEALPYAIVHGYGQLPLLAVVLTAWAMWLGHRYAKPGPMPMPSGPLPAAALALLGGASIAAGASWVACYSIGPAVLIILNRVRPTLATPRVLMLLFLAPTSYYLDQYFGAQLQTATATGAGWIAHFVDGTIGMRSGDQLSCGAHTIWVTPQCSGARLSIRMLALAAVLGVLKPSPPKRMLILLASSLVFSAATNVGRIAALCIAAPSYRRDEFADLESYHDASGLVAFVIAYVVLGWLAGRLRPAKTGADQTRSGP